MVAEDEALIRTVGAANPRSVVVLVGEAGAGKSRLARSVVDAAAASELPVLTGRGVPGASPLPYRPLTEAFLGAFRSRTLPDDPSLAGFGRHLGRLVPAWQTGPLDTVEAPVLLGEAVVRLLRVHGDGRATMLLLEDVHWADPETLEVVDYLADAIRSEPVLVLCTTRPDGAAADLTVNGQRLELTEDTVGHLFVSASDPA